MSRTFSSSLRGGNGVSVRAAGSVSPAGATGFDPTSLGSQVWRASNSTTPRAPAMPDECEGQGGSWQLKPGTETEFTCVLPTFPTPRLDLSRVPGSPGAWRVPMTGVTDSRGVPMTGVTDSRGVPMTGVTDSRGVPMTGVTDSRGVPMTGVTDSRTVSPNGTGDRRGGAPGTGDRSGGVRPNGTGDRTGATNGTTDRTGMPNGVWDSRGVPVSGNSDWCPPGYVPTLNADFCPPEYLRSVYASASPPPDWRKDPYWGSVFGSRYAPAPVGGVHPSFGWEPNACGTGYAPVGMPTFPRLSATPLQGAGAVFGTSSSSADLFIGAAALAAGAYVGWKIGDAVQARSGSRARGKRTT